MIKNAGCDIEGNSSFLSDRRTDMIHNPILPGFNPDPCICRKGDDYYIAVSTFEWMPGIPIYHSRDLVHWELLTHVLTDDVQVDLKKVPSAKGIWAPCLTYCAAENLFYVVYGVMNSMNARYFDVDNFVVTAEEIITEPWSDPVYLHSAGFDASMLHDDDGRKYVVSLEWETREGYEKPGVICAVEYDPAAKHIIGYPRRIWRGSTDRGCIEAPHLTKKNGWYYLMCAEGGTGYNHAVTMARSRSVFGPYEPDPLGAIVTSQPEISNERADADHLKPKYFNPDSVLQKSGHGSYVDLPNGETYLVHLTARPWIIRDTEEERKALSPYAPKWPAGYMPEGILDLRCTLGRETAIEKMVWTEDGWLRMADGTNLAMESVPEPELPQVQMKSVPDRDDFDSGVLGNWYYAPRQMPERFADVKARPGFVRLRGQESQASLNKVSLLARKLTGIHATAVTVLEYSPEVYQHDAGLMLYYDNMNNLSLRKYYSETLHSEALGVIQLENGHKTEFVSTRTAVEKGRPIWMQLTIDGRRCFFAWSYDGSVWQRIGEEWDISIFSDEYCKYGEFTGTMVGLFARDSMLHEKYADFDRFDLTVVER